ncbi:MAG: hypothetical protein JJ850_17155 [Kordiimonadaceae bacterium]|nr:hypothetical protein [Kordiimonadaceae bacterium]MBO6570528.1 hypothetical protein [Kordiimonadaceae bacterium]MBO6966353.1 hypothetical protein [Kordiimonadaceae bacterium]
MARDPITKAPKVWFTYCGMFHQDFMLMGSTFDEALEFSINSFFGGRQRSELRDYLEELAESDLTEGQIRKMFEKGGAHWLVRGKIRPLLMESVERLKD